MAARFFCDNCGTEVKRNAGRCPGCNRLFAFVRCPQCGYTGEEEKFAGGCPICGYCTEKKKKKPKTLSKKPSLVTTGKLPYWVYIIAFLGFILVVLALFFTIRSTF